MLHSRVSVARSWRSVTKQCKNTWWVALQWLAAWDTREIFRVFVAKHHDCWFTEALRRVCRAIVARPIQSPPVKVVLMSTGLYTKPDSLQDVKIRNTCGQRALLFLLSTCLPPHNDNMRAAEFLRTELMNQKGIEWCGVRPELLIDGEVSQYEVNESLVCSIFSAGQTSRSNVAHFMCELIQNSSTWQKWKGTFPLIYNASAAEW